jgi:hypothetical protein
MRSKIALNDNVKKIYKIKNLRWIAIDLVKRSFESVGRVLKHNFADAAFATESR